MTQDYFLIPDGHQRRIRRSKSSGNDRDDRGWTMLHVRARKGDLKEDEIEIEAKALRVGKAVAVVSVEFRKKKTGKIIAQGRHTKYLAVSSKL